MASLSRTKSGWVVQFGEPRKTIRLGHLSDKLAQQTRARIEQLIQCREVGAIDKSTGAWLVEIGPELSDKLARVGLIKPLGRDTLKPFLDRVIEPTRNTRTLANLRQTQTRLVEYFGDVDLRSITHDQADAWLADLKAKEYAVATWSGYVKKARSFFKTAIRWGLTESNPFTGIKASSQANPKRMVYVHEETVRTLIDNTTAPLGRVLALVRFGGLRCPSEVSVMDWSHFDWEQGAWEVHSPKTGLRVVPLFPELREYLEGGKKESGPVISGIHADKNLRSRLLRLIDRCGLDPWERLFHNMRSSRQTDLTKRFGLSAACKWLGNSPAIADKHYLQALEEDFQAALCPALHHLPETSENGRHPECDVLPFLPTHSRKTLQPLPLRGVPKTLKISNYCRELGFCAAVRAAGLGTVIRQWDSLTVRQKAAIVRSAA